MRTEARDAERLANIFRDYIVPIVPLITDDIDVVTDAFVRINSQGKEMSEAHMLRALAFRKIDMDAYFEDIRSRLELYGWSTVSDKVLVNTLKAKLNLDVYTANVRGVYNRLEKDLSPLKQLGDAMVDAVEFLASLGVRGPGALPYTYQLVTLAALSYDLDYSLTDKRYFNTLKSWFWTSTYTAFFSGSTGSRIRDGISKLLLALIGVDKYVWDNPNPVAPISNIRTSTGRTSAFLLFLVNLPENKNARQRRQEWLGQEKDRIVPSLFSKAQAQLPGNRVIASGFELRKLRDAIKTGRLTEAMADEYGIPTDALKVQNNADEFTKKRNDWLIQKENEFIISLGLELSVSDT
jgi:hypothetical protein